MINCLEKHFFGEFCSNIWKTNGRPLLLQILQTLQAELFTFIGRTHHLYSTSRLVPAGHYKTLNVVCLTHICIALGFSYVEMYGDVVQYWWIKNRVCTRRDQNNPINYKVRVESYLRNFFSHWEKVREVNIFTHSHTNTYAIDKHAHRRRIKRRNRPNRVLYVLARIRFFIDSVLCI